MLKLAFILALLNLVWGYNNKVEAPYLVSIRNSSVHLCSGTIITEGWVLTVAGCVYGLKAASLTILFGNPDKKKFSMSLPVYKMKVHEKYQPGKFINDFALLLGNRRLRFNGYVNFVPLPNQPTRKGAKLIANGWNVTGDKNQTYTMKRVNEVAITNDECQQKRGHEIHESILCTEYAKGTKEADLFHGYGGPVLENNKLAGLVIDYVSPSMKLPGLNARVKNALRWIRSNMR